MKKKRDNLLGFGEHTNYLKTTEINSIYEYYIIELEKSQLKI